MKVFDAPHTREAYFSTQIARSNQKFRYCKVSMSDVMKYQALLRRDRADRHDRTAAGPILCLGTRNGREVDLFRIAYFGSRLSRDAVTLCERRRPPFQSWWPRLEAMGRSTAAHIRPDSVIGVEINPRAARSDIWVGSFDDMPQHWERQFGVVFSNSFDQSEDPVRTAREWRRVARSGGYLIVCFAKDQKPTMTDPVGELRLADLLELFGGELVYFHQRGSRNNYTEVVLRW